MKNKIPQPINNILLQLKEPLATTIETKGGFKLELVNRFNFEWNATCEGIIVGIPKDNPFYGKLKIGDTVYFQYNVVANRSFKSDADYFNPYIEENYFKQYYSGQGEKITICAVPGIISKKWVGAYFDKRGTFANGIEGSESEVERWKSQFKFGGVQTYEFKNLIYYKGVQYWKCKYDQVFAKKKGDNIEAIGDRVILEPIDIELPKEVKKEMGIINPNTLISGRASNMAKLFSAPHNFKYKNGDILSFDDRFIERYKFNNKDFYLVKENRIDGRFV